MIQAKIYTARLFYRLTDKQDSDEKKCLTPSKFWNFLNNIQKVRETDC